MNRTTPIRDTRQHNRKQPAEQAAKRETGLRQAGQLQTEDAGRHAPTQAAEPARHDPGQPQAEPLADPRFDPRALRACLGQFATGVTVVTASGPSGPAGVTANSFSSLSLDPPLVMWGIAKSSRSFQTFKHTDRFAINILASDQILVSQAFSSRQLEKFEGIAWRPGECGPILDDVAAVLECETEATHEGGDHLILIGRIRNFRTHDRNGLIFVQGRYSIASEHPALRQGGLTRSDVAEAPLMGLLLQAYHHMVTQFEEPRRANDLSINQSKLLFSLHGEPCELGQLASKLLLGQRECDDAINSFVADGSVQIDENGICSLTDGGQARWAALRRTAEQFEAGELRGIPDEEVRAARSFLERFIGNARPPVLLSTDAGAASP